jgi:hypothetical protein
MSCVRRSTTTSTTRWTATESESTTSRRSSRHQSVLIEEGDGTRTVVCCQASWNASSFAVATLGDDGWDETTGAASLEKLHAVNPDRVLLSHDRAEWRPRR